MIISTYAFVLRLNDKLPVDFFAGSLFMGLIEILAEIGVTSYHINHAL